jgi:hypothetical protein
MNHFYQGAIRTVSSHIRTAAIHQRAVAAQPLSSFTGKQSVDALAGFYLRSFESHRVLNDCGVDVIVAQQILDNTAKAGQPAVGPLSELAMQAKGGSYEARQSVKAALQSMLDEINDGLKANLPILQAMLKDAKRALVKAAANNALDTKSLRNAGGAGLQLVEGTHVHRHLPAEVIHGIGGMTDAGEKRLAEFVSKDYLREIEDNRILADEYAAHDKRAIKASLKAKAVAALSSLGGGN